MINEEEELSDLLLYQEVEECLIFIKEQLKLNPKVPTLWEKYEHCEKLIQKLKSDEKSSFFKDILKELEMTFQWQKENLMRNFNEKQGNETSKFKIKTAANKPDDDDSKTRRQMVLNTVVTNKNVTLNDVAGLKDAKQIFNEAIVLPLRFPHLFSGAMIVHREEMKVCASCKQVDFNPRLISHMQRKSRLALAVSSEINSTFFSISSADLMSSWVGESEKMVRELFHCARETDGDSLIFIDEIDSICRRRTSNEDEHTRRVKTELLKQMDGIDNNRGANRVYLLCATNCPWELDSAFLRRFQKRIYIPLPDRWSRMEILRIHTKETTTSFSDTDWGILLDKTEGFSGSDIATLAMAALLLPISELQSNTYWKKTQDGMAVPFRTGNEHEAYFQCKLEDIAADKVLPRDVNVNDFLNALSTSHRTVSQQDLKQFEEFTKQYGQTG